METLLASATGSALAAAHGRRRAKEALGAAARAFHAGTLVPDPAPEGTALVEALAREAGRSLGARRPAGPGRVINATGVLLHTNLGRAPLAAAAREALERAAGFCDLEYDVASGRRGKRSEHVRPLLLELFAPERTDVDVVVTVNNAAALLLALDTVANGRPVAISRGELVAIGGDFRVPSILARSGASLLETGTTNKTAPADYEEALDRGAAAILKVHPSNYRIVGYTEEVALPELAALAHRRGVPLVYDAGAGAPLRFHEPGLADEPLPARSLADGADLVCFSGDKTLGGPQAGILLGRKTLVEAAARNPLARALRPDKLVLAALAATLDLYLSGREDEVPFVRMLRVPLETLEARAGAIVAAARAAGLLAEVVESTAVAGGGSGTESALPSRAVALQRPGAPAETLALGLRRHLVPVIARIAGDRVLLDLRSVAPEDDAALVAALRAPAP